MAKEDMLDKLKSMPVPEPREAARKRALSAAMDAFDKENQFHTQGLADKRRQSTIVTTLWSKLMDRKLLTNPALATILALPIAGYAAYMLVNTQNGGAQLPDFARQSGQIAGGRAQGTAPVLDLKATRNDSERRLDKDFANAPSTEVESKRKAQRDQALHDSVSAQRLPAMKPAEEPAAAAPATRDAGQAASSTLIAREKQNVQGKMIPVPPRDNPVVERQSRDRVQSFDTNPVKQVAVEPVSTFSIDVDTASYALVRRSLMEGHMPNPASVRVEEMINYFPYSWPGPDSLEKPFNSTVTVTPTPWNTHTELMHIGIKGYDVSAINRPKANLVFLIDVSGSMNAPDKLPLLKTAFRMLLGKLQADDTVSIVTYAGNAGTVLEPTRADEKQKILDAIDKLTPGGSTAGAAGIEQAYHLAKQAFVKDGVNRVMLATDGDFNVGPSSDEALKKMIEKNRESGIFLSVFGFGQGNYNDQLMQTLAQNGNGTAAYIDTLAEAQKTLVEEAGSTLFPIAKDVKIQVEFNPERIAEYRLIGYETRALKREDFNNDRVDAGEIGSGHSVTAIYEITPKGSPAQRIDDLRYGKQTQATAPASKSDELAFLKIRYKAPDGDTSKLITTPVTDANAVENLDAASNDVRFSIAVAGFGQKLRHTDETATYGYDQILDLASTSRGEDSYGYRAEFLQLVRIADGLGQ
jgi:Ca-activated chloride channel family protein